MPLEILNIPNQVSYSQEPILFTVKASSVFTDALEGRKMTLSIAFDAGIEAVKKLILSSMVKK